MAWRNLTGEQICLSAAVGGKYFLTVDKLHDYPMIWFDCKFIPWFYCNVHLIIYTENARIK